MNLATIIEPHDAERIALVGSRGSTSYGELRRQVAAVRSRLEAEGLGVASRVFIACGNEPEFASAALGVLAMGGIAVPLNPRSPLPELLARIELVQPERILVGTEMRSMLDHAESIPVPLIDLGEIGDDGAEPRPPVERDDDDFAFFMLTSGVTGEPKAAMLSHGNLGWVQELTCEAAVGGIHAEDVVLCVLPFAHIFGLNVALLASLRAGATCVLEERFETYESLDLIRTHRVTRIAAVPPMWKRWAEADAPVDSFATVGFASSGAAALPVEVFEAVRDRYGLEIAEGYGLTETSPIVTLSRGVPVRPGSVGKVPEGIEVALVDDDGELADQGDVGEIVVRSPGVFKGYLDAPDVTDMVLTDDGWFWTGDVGVFDEDGYLYLVDRVKDIIIVSGFNVYPGEVEAVIDDAPGVDGVLVIGEPHPTRGEAVIAYVTGSASEGDLNDFARERLSGYKCPLEYRFVDELPIAESGKAIRKQLRPTT